MKNMNFMPSPKCYKLNSVEKLEKIEKNWLPTPPVGAPGIESFS